MNILITGGAGFIGRNISEFFLTKGDKVLIYDNLSRQGSEKNLSELRNNYSNAKFIKGDVEDIDKLKQTVKDKNVIIHLAGQVAVTSSVKNPREDFYSNALGTFNVLEAVRKINPEAIVLFASTNKVYGEITGEEIIEHEKRYAYKNLKKGVPENYPLDFHSPYGCSKGAADQYVRDYARIYKLKTVVFRQSCIYGPHQFGIEDQGWLAWFMIAAYLGKPITIYGNGKQVRDILYIEDLIKLYDAAINKINIAAGQIYNVGGGEENTISIWQEFKPILEELLCKKIEADYSDWRPGDQPIYVSDIRKAKRDFNWKPKIGVKEGIKKLYDWVSSNKDLFNF